MIRYIKSKNLTYTQPTGVSLDDPIGWTDVVTESNTYSTSNDSTNLWRYFAIKLNAGTKYTIKQTVRSFDTAFWFYNIDKSVITSVDSDSPSSPSSDGRIDNDSSNETFYYTPSVTGVYCLCWGAYSSGTGTATIEITPKPEIYTLSEPTIVPSIGIDKWGFPIEYSSVHLAKINISQNTNDEYSKLFISFEDGVVDTAKGNTNPITLTAQNVTIRDGVGVFNSSSKIDCSASNFDFANNDKFTLEFYINFSQLPTSDSWGSCMTLFVTYETASSSDQNALRFGNSIVNWQYNDGGYFIDTSMNYINTNTWYHFALVKNGSTYLMFIDGEKRAEKTNTSTVLNYPSCQIGYESDSAHFVGKLKNFNLSIGIARYLENFKPLSVSGIYQPKSLGTLVTPDNMSSDTSEDWVITSTGNYGDKYVWKAFDGNYGTLFDGRGSEDPRFFGWQYLKGKTKIDSYILYNKATGATEDNLGEWILQGSNDGSSWDDLHHVGADEVYINWTTTPEVFTPTTSGFYSHYRINCLKNSLGTTKREYLPYITEFKAYGEFQNN